METASVVGHDGAADPERRVEAMSAIILFAAAVAVGFFAAAVLAGVYRGLTSRQVSFTLIGPGAASTVASFMFRLLVGPAIIVRQSVVSAQSGAVPSSWAAAGVMVAAVWSGCLGLAILAIVTRIVG